MRIGPLVLERRPTPALEDALALASDIALATEMKRRTGERGSTGLYSFGGWLSMDDQIDYLAAMRPPDRWVNVDKMRMGDPSVRAAYLSLILPILSTKLSIAPGSPDQEDLRIGQFVQDDFDGFTVALSEHRRESLLSLPYGVAPFEIVYEYREDGLLHVRKPAYRPPHTVQQWLVDDTGGPAGIVQTTPHGPVPLPIEDLLIFVNEREGGNIVGQSILRSAYKPWWYLDKLEGIAMVAAEFHAKGIQVGTQENDSDKLMRFIEKSLKAVRVHQTMFIREVPDFKYRIEKPGEPMDLLPLLNYMRIGVYLTTLSTSLALGTTGSVGSWALADERSSFQGMALRGFMENLENCYNRYLIPPWVRANFGNVPTNRMPRVTHSPLDTRKIAEWFDALTKAVTAGIIPPDDEPIRLMAREMLGLPEQIVSAPAMTPNQEAATQPLDEGEGTSGVTAKRARAVRAARATDGRLESVVKLEALGIKPNFVRMTAALDKGEAAIVQRVTELQRKQAYILAKTGAKIVQSGDAAAIAKALDDLSYDEEAAAFADELDGLYDNGESEAGDELSSQGVKVVKTGNDRRQTDKALLAALGLAAGAELASRMGSAWAAEVTRQLVGDGKADRAAIMAAVVGLSGKLLLDLAAQRAGRALGMGRAATHDANADAIDHFIVTAAMDSNTCGPCEKSDGAEYPPGEEPTTPLDWCEGADRCRCEVVAVVK